MSFEKCRPCCSGLGVLSRSYLICQQMLAAAVATQEAVGQL